MSRSGIATSVFLLAFVACIAAIIVIFLVPSLLGQAEGPEPESDAYRIAIVSLVEIDPIVELRTGFKDRIRRSPIHSRVTYSEINPQGDLTRLSSIVDQMANDPPDLAYVLGTPAAQAIQGRIPSLPIVQGAVTDPVAAELAATWAASGRAYTGVSDLPPPDLLATLGHALVGTHGRLAVIYNPGEANSVSVVTRLRAAARRLDFTVIDVPAATSGEIPAAAQAALLRADAILIPPDNTVTTASRAVIQAANRAGKPVLGTTEALLNEGATVVVALDFRLIGEQSAELALRILDGADPSRIPIAVSDRPSVLVSRAMLDRLRIPADRFANIAGVQYR